MEAVMQGGLIGEWAETMRATGAAEQTVELRCRELHHLVTSAWVSGPELLTRRHVVAWLGRDLSQASRCSYWSTVRAWMVWCSEWDVPCADLLAGIPRPPQPRAVPRPIAAEQARAVLALQLPARPYAYVRLGLFAGLRASEVASVRGEDFADGWLTICGKGSDVAMVPVHPEIEALRLVWPERGWWFPRRDDPSQHVDGRRVTEASRKALREVGVTEGSHHRLRHTYATGIQAATGDIRVTQLAMRHRSVASTAIYAGVSDTRLIGAVTGLGTAA